MSRKALGIDLLLLHVHIHVHTHYVHTYVRKHTHTHTQTLDGGMERIVIFGELGTLLENFPESRTHFYLPWNTTGDSSRVILFQTGWS